MDPPVAADKIVIPAVGAERIDADYSPVIVTAEHLDFPHEEQNVQKLLRDQILSPISVDNPNHIPTPPFRSKANSERKAYLRQISSRKHYTTFIP